MIIKKCLNLLLLGSIICNVVSVQAMKRSRLTSCIRYVGATRSTPSNNIITTTYKRKLKLGTFSSHTRSYCSKSMKNYIPIKTSNMKRYKVRLSERIVKLKNRYIRFKSPKHVG